MTNRWKRACVLVLAASLAACGQPPPQVLGTLEWDRVTLPAPVAERIVRIDVREGEVVAAGAPLLQLELTRSAAQAEAWAREFDGHSLLVLGRCSKRFDVMPDLGRIKAKVLYVLSSTDLLFPPSLEGTVMGALRQAGVDARYFLLESAHGHLASGTDALKWAPALKSFLDALG